MMDAEKLRNLTEDQVFDYQSKLKKGERASRIMEDPILVEAFRNLKADITAALIQASPGSKQAEECHYLYKALEQVEKEIRSFIDGGKEALSILKAREEQEPEQKAERRWIDPPKK